MEAALGHEFAEDEALARLGGDEVLALLGRLTEEQRTVLALRLVANLTIPEVAEIVGRTVNATKALQRRGLKTLRKQLHDRMDS
jgi:RNA polymerase sigma-70 factor (ECF subfamily)